MASRKLAERCRCQPKHRDPNPKRFRIAARRRSATTLRLIELDTDLRKNAGSLLLVAVGKTARQSAKLLMAPVTRLVDGFDESIPIQGFRDCGSRCVVWTPERSSVPFLVFVWIAGRSAPPEFSRRTAGIDRAFIEK